LVEALLKLSLGPGIYMGIDQMEIDQKGIDQMLNFKTGYPVNYKNLCLDFVILSKL